MRRIARITALAAIPLAALATAGEAQLAGIPVYFNPRGGTGVGVAANLGFPDNNAGGGTAYGVSGSLGVGPLTISAMGGAWKGTGFGSAQTSFGADVAYRLFGGGILPVAVAVQAGFGTVKNPLPLVGGTYNTIPVGVGSTTSKFRVSGGVNFNVLLGLGVHAAVDYTPSSPSATILGVGAHFNFHVPM
jgi:hypothetical protein